MQDSVASAVTAVSSVHPTNHDLDQSGEHNEDDEREDLFTSSIATTSSTASKGSKHKHKHKKKGRSDSQLSGTSSKSGKTHKEKTSSKEGKYQTKVATIHGVQRQI